MKVFILLGCVDYEGSTVLHVYADRSKADALQAAHEQYQTTRPQWPYHLIEAMSGEMTEYDKIEQKLNDDTVAWAALSPNPEWVWYDRLRVLEQDVIA